MGHVLAGAFKHLRRREDCLASTVIEDDVEEALQQ
jgi:hypothetical protein